MSTLVDPRELVGLAEAVEIAGVSQDTFRGWMRAKDAPEPVVRLKGGSLWLRSDIEAWAAMQHARRP